MRKSQLLELLLWVALCSASTAWADADNTSNANAVVDDTWNLLGGVGISHDDNLFLAPQGHESADEIRNATFRIKVDKPYSLQRFTVDAKMTDYHYRDNDYLNYMGKDLNAGWAWSLSPSLYGKLSTSRVDSLNSFVDYVAATPEQRRNIRVTKNSRFDVEWEAMGPVHLISAVSHYDQTNSQTFIQDDNYSSSSREFGVKYVTAARNSIALVRRQTQGDFSRDADVSTLLDSGFEQSEDEVNFFWMPTVKSSVVGRVAYVDRDYDNFSSRNYAGYIGSIDANWGITEKLSLLLNLHRDLNAYQDALSTSTSYSSFYSSNNYKISPVWALSEKTRISLSLGHESRDYDGTVVNGQPLRNDSFEYRGLAMEWMPRKSIDVNLAWQRQTRDSNNDLYNFDDNVWMLSALFKF